MVSRAKRGRGEFMAEIYCKDLQEISNAVIDYHTQITNAGEAAIQATSTLSSLSRFQGQGPDAIKVYFLEVHAGLVPSFIELFGLFRNQFAVYSGTYTSTPVNETSEQGRLPSDGIKGVKKDAKEIKNSLSSNIDSHLSRANAKVNEADVSVSKPNTNNLKNEINECITVLTKLFDDINSNESNGLNMFSDDSLFERMRTGLDRAIATCSQPGYMASYTPGKVMQEPWFAPLSQALAESQTFQDEHFDELRQIEKELANKRETRIRAEYEAAREKKLWWSKVGTLASIAGLAAGVVALAAAAGPIALTVGALGVCTSMIDVFERSENLNQQLRGNAEDDRMKNVPSGAGKDMFDEYMGYAKNIEKEGLAGGAFKEIDDLKGYATEKSAEAVVSYAVYEATGNKEFSDTAGKLGGKATTIGKEASKIAEGGVTGTTAGVTFVTKVVTIGADYGVSEADKKLDECNEKFAQVEKTRNQIDSTPRHIENAWASAA